MFFTLSRITYQALTKEIKVCTTNTLKGTQLRKTVKIQVCFSSTWTYIFIWNDWEHLSNIAPPKIFFLLWEVFVDRDRNVNFIFQSIRNENVLYVSDIVVPFKIKVTENPWKVIFILKRNTTMIFYFGFTPWKLEQPPRDME